MLDRRVENVQDQVRILHTFDGPSDGASWVLFRHATAVDLSFSREVLHYVPAIQFVGPVATESSVHEIADRHFAAHSLDPDRSGKAAITDVTHQHRHQPLADEGAQTPLVSSA
jgi:uncharacterized protein YndB with AHSA1/START domain